MKPLIITAAILGAELSREKQPYLPLSVEEIVKSAVECYEAGASIIHLHVRDAEGKPSSDLQIFKEIIQKIKSKCDVILQVSTGGALGDSFEDRLLVVEAGAEMASLSMGSVNFGEDVFLNPLPFIKQLANKMQQFQVKPELEIFDLAMLEQGLRFIEEGWVLKPAHFQFVLGVPGALAASEENLELLISRLPQHATWSLAAIGRFQFSLLNQAIALGGNVRVGFEDNIYLEKGVLAKTNAELVAKVVCSSKSASRLVATVEETKTLLSLE